MENKHIFLEDQNPNQRSTFIFFVIFSNPCVFIECT